MGSWSMPTPCDRPDAAKDIVRATMRLTGVPCERERHFAEFYWGGKPAHTR